MDSTPMTQQMSLFPQEPAFQFRKADPPSLGPSFEQRSTVPLLFESVPGSMSLMFDTSKLTLGDYHNMRTHPQVHASLSLMTFMIHQADWKIECKDKKVAETIEDNMRQIWTELVRGISTGYWAGYAPNVLEWDNASGPDSDGELDRIYVTKVKDLNPMECSVNWKEVESNYTPRPGDLVSGQPFDRRNMPKVKLYDGIKKFGLAYPIPPEQTFWYPVLMENGNHYGKKLLEPAFMPWYFSILVHLYANRYFERFGEPVPIGRAPIDQDFEYSDGAGGTVRISAKQAMEQILTNLRSSGKVVLPSDRDDSASNNRSEYLWDVEYLESQMRGADFERYLDRLDEEISLAIFTPMLLMRSGDKGSLNLGVQHTQTWLWSLNAMMGDLKLYIDKYLVQRIKAYNFNQNAPRAEWVPRKMGKDNTETLRAIVSQLISKDMAKPDLEEMGTALGMSLQEIRTAAPDPNTIVDTRDRSERDRTEDGPRTAGDDLPTTTSQ